MYTFKYRGLTCLHIQFPRDCIAMSAEPIYYVHAEGPRISTTDVVSTRKRTRIIDIEAIGRKVYNGVPLTQVHHLRARVDDDQLAIRLVHAGNHLIRLAITQHR